MERGEAQRKPTCISVSSVHWPPTFWRKSLLLMDDVAMAGGSLGGSLARVAAAHPVRFSPS